MQNEQPSLNGLFVNVFRGVVVAESVIAAASRLGGQVFPIACGIITAAGTGVLAKAFGARNRRMSYGLMAGVWMGLNTHSPIHNVNPLQEPERDIGAAFAEAFDNAIGNDVRKVIYALSTDTPEPPGRPGP
jgi:hypothetical protein